MPVSLRTCQRDLTAYRWSSVPTKGDAPPHGCCHTLVNYKDKFLVFFGGGALDYAYNDVYIFDLSTSTWSYKETTNREIVAPRISHTAVIHGDKMYVYGGQDVAQPQLFSEVFVLNLLTFTWSLLHSAPQEPDGPGERRLHSAHTYGNRMYVLMGEPCRATTNFWYLDLETEQWHTLHSSAVFGKPILPLIGHSAQVEGENLYIFGGYRINTVTRASPFVYSNSLYCYNFRTNTWREVLAFGGPSPSPRYSAAMTVVCGRVYIHGGDVEGEVYYDDFWHIDATAEVARWVDATLESGRARPSARSGHASVVARGALYVLGGELPGDTSAIYYSNSMYRYPLGLFTRLPLEELASRWLAKSNQINMRVLQQQIPRGIHAALARNSPAAHREGSDALILCTRGT